MYIYFGEPWGFENDFIEEVKECVWSMHILTTLSPDGFSRVFFWSYWDTIGGQVATIVQKGLSFKISFWTHQQNLQCPYTKTKQVVNFNHFHPINLCNFTYKIISKILTWRLKKLFPWIIFPKQSAFVEGRWITENTVVTQKILHKVRKLKGRNGLMLLKLDKKNAFNRMK